MILVTFKTQEEVVSFYKHFSKFKRRQYRLMLNGNTIGIQFGDEEFNAADKDAFIQIFVDFVISTFEEKWLLDFISHNFYFEDENEQMEIIEIARSILEGGKGEIPAAQSLPSRKELIYHALEDVIKDEHTLCFDSVITFRLVEYKNCLLRLVELAIDEYQLQQEYHMFIDKLREIIRAYKPLHQTIHVVDEKPFVLFNEKLEEINAHTRVRSFYPLLRQWGIDIEPSILITLISLAPAIIHIYTNRRDSGLMTTIENVFEERVIFHPLIASKPLKSCP